MNTEKAYQNFRMNLSFKMFSLFYTYILLALIVAFIRNIYLKGWLSIGRVISLTIFLGMWRSFILKNLRKLDVSFCCLIIFNYCLHLWFFFPKLATEHSKEYMLYLGSALESLRIFLFISQINWRWVFLTNIIINIFLFDYAIVLHEFQKKETIFQLLFPMIMVNTMPLVGYQLERHQRENFFKTFSFYKSLKSFEILINQILPQQIIIIDKALESVLFFNEEARKFHETEDSRLLIEKIATIKLDSDKNERLFGLLKNNVICQEESKFFDFTTTIEKIDTEYCFDAKIGKIHWQGQDAFLLLLSDISVLKQLTKLQELDAYKDRLLATVSHDLRTPLNGLNGILELISSKIQDKSIKKFLKIATRCSNLLLFMINDILDFSQINSGKLRLNSTKSSVFRIIKEVFTLIKFQVKRKNIALKMDIPPELKSLHIYTDSRRVQQILLNLLSNALKFTTDGHIKLSIRMESRRWLNFAVEDTGVGMEKDELPKLFKLFSKLENKDSALNTTGIGLGLVISQCLVRLLSGNAEESISVQSEKNKGTTFNFKLPCMVSEEEEINEEFQENEARINENYRSYNKRIHAPNLSPKKGFNNKGGGLNGVSDQHITVLIVDDDQINTFIVSKYLESFGLEYQIASDGKKAIEKVNDFGGFSLVLLDCNMPIMNGFECAKILKETKKKLGFSYMKVIGLTAGISLKESNLAKACGMDEILFKPISRNTLKEKIEEIFNISL